MKQDVKIHSTTDFKKLFLQQNIQWTSNQDIHFSNISSLAEKKTWYSSTQRSSCKTNHSLATTITSKSMGLTRPLTLLLLSVKTQEQYTKRNVHVDCSDQTVPMHWVNGLCSMVDPCLATMSFLTFPTWKPNWWVKMVNSSDFPKTYSDFSPSRQHSIWMR